MYRLLITTLKLERSIADRDRQVAAAFRLYEAEIVAFQREQGDLTVQLQQYYLTHLEEVEKGGKKSLQLTYGLMGRRLGLEALCLLNKSWTWSAVKAKLQSLFGTQYMRVIEPEIDKEKIKAEFPRDQFREMGMKLQQEERFFVDVARPPQNEAY